MKDYADADGRGRVRHGCPKQSRHGSSSSLTSFLDFFPETFPGNYRSQDITQDERDEEEDKSIVLIFGI